MNNQYVFSPKIDLDLDIIKNIAFRRRHQKNKNMATHHRLVCEESYLVEIQQQYPFLGNVYNVYHTPPGYEMPLHVCTDRLCALNIPIQYTEDSHTIFYDVGDNPKTIYDEDRRYHLILSEAREVFRYTLTEPVIMNTGIPHKVIGGPRMPRLIMSWSINFRTSYEELRSIYG